jgi:hypothetical protein
MVSGGKGPRASTPAARDGGRNHFEFVAPHQAALAGVRVQPGNGDAR